MTPPRSSAAPVQIRRRFAFCLSVFVLGLTLVGSTDRVSAADHQRAGSFQKILFLGNSITKHGPKPSIGWTSNWGMAASAEEKDYVHLVTSGLTKTGGKAPETMVRSMSVFERGYATFDIDAQLKAECAFQADLVILAIGENVPQLKSAEEQAKFKAGVTKILSQLKAASNPVIVVRSCFWPNKTKDDILKAACEEVGGIYVDISDLAKDEANYGRSERKFEHKGVAAHPGDKGMQGIADAILKALASK